MASPRKANGENKALLRLHPRGQPPLHTSHAPPPPTASAGYPYVPVPHRSRLSPRQVKLQRMESSPPYTLAIPLRDQVSSNFHHELLQFHQLLRDAVDTTHQEHLQHKCTDVHRPALLNHGGRLLELLTSDRGDAVLKQFFAQWQQYLSGKRAPGESSETNMLWDVLETFFGCLPLVVSQNECSNPKVFLRYIDSLNSLRGLLIALLFKTIPEPTEDLPLDDDDEKGIGGLESSIGLGFGLDFTGRRMCANSSSRSVPRSPQVDKPRDRIPLYLYCHQLEKELETLRRRMPHRKHSNPEAVTGIVGDVGLLRDNTVMLLLDYWTLPHEERLAFFCQIASQASEEDASAILHIFLSNCTTEMFLQVWGALQQGPQFQKMIREAALQLKSTTNNEGPTSTNTEADKQDERDDSVLVAEATDLTKPSRRGSQRNMNKQTRRSTRFMDFHGITDAFDYNKELGIAEEDEDEDSSDTIPTSPRSHKIRIRERGRLSLSGPSEKPAPVEQDRGILFRQDTIGSRRRALKSPRTGEAQSLMERVHDNLTEIIKMEDGPDAPVMDAVWQLLEALDGHRAHESKYRRRNIVLPLPASPMPAIPAQPQQHQEVAAPHSRSSLRTPLSTEQQFIMKLDQLQSMLVALGDVRIHSMSTDTITGAYRRIPNLAKLFSALADASLGAAGVDITGGGLLKIVSSYSKAQNVATSWQGVASKEKILDLMPGASVVSEPLGQHTSGDNVREDVEAMGMLLTKLSKFVRSLTPLVENEDAAPSNVSASDKVLTILDLAGKLESAGALAEVPPPGLNGDGGKRRLTLAADRELPIILAVQSLARSKEFDDASHLILTAVEAKIARVRANVMEAQPNDENGEDDEDGDDSGEDVEGELAMEEEDEEVLKIVRNIRRGSAKAAHEAHDQMKLPTRRGATGGSRKTAHIQEVQDRTKAQMQGGVSPSEGDAATLRPPNRDIPSNIKNSTLMRGLKLFRVDILMRIVNQLYRDSYEGMVSTLQYGSRRMEFSEFIYDWHIRKYGLKTLAQRHLLKLIQSLRKYEKKVFQCQLCLRFMAIQGLLSRWSLGTFSGGSKHRIALPKQQFKIRIAFAISTVQEALREKFGVFGRGIDTLADRIRAKAIPRDDEFVRENDLLILCVEDFALQRTLLEKVLGAVYLAGDINGDGSLEFDEFASVVTHLSPTVDDRFLQKVFEAAHDFNKPNRISFARFLDVILLERVLSPVAPSAATTGAMRAKNAAATTNGNMGGEVPAVSGGGSQQSSDVVKEVSQDEQEEVYQFELLRETWTHDREAVTHVLQTSITHAPTAKSLTFRVAFLDQLLERRVDSKTAWLCHRQIMREIARYQHLDADQIAGLRHKELQFQKAVRAIRTAQRLSALTPASREAGEDESNLHDGAARNAADSISSPNYTAAVRGISFETPSADMPNVADVAALENELRETFLERADERAIDDYMTAIQHLRRVSVKQQSVLLELHDHMTLLGPEEAVSEVDEENDEESDEDGKEEDNDDQGDGSDGEG